MRAGTLRERVEIQSKSVARNAYGEEVITWTELDTVWASVEPMTGVEFYEESAERSTVNTRIRIRRRSDVSPDDRVLHGSDVYDIRAVIEPHSNRRETQLMCVRTVS